MTGRTQDLEEPGPSLAEHPKNIGDQNDGQFPQSDPAHLHPEGDGAEIVEVIEHQADQNPVEYGRVKASDEKLRGKIGDAEDGKDGSSGPHEHVDESSLPSGGAEEIGEETAHGQPNAKIRPPKAKQDEDFPDPEVEHLKRDRRNEDCHHEVKSRDESIVDDRSD